MDQEHAPIVTVLMSVFNGERWLAESIQSILNQSFIDFEFIIVNDGSTDSSYSVIQYFAGLDPRIKVINKANSGLCDSLNHGLREASGCWIARIDADDISLPDRLAKQVQASTVTYRNSVLVGTGFAIIDENGKRIKVYSNPKKYKSLLKSLSTLGAGFPHSSAFFDRRVALDLGGYRTRIARAQDLDLWLRLSEVGNIHCISEPLVLIRKHVNQVSHEGGGQLQLTNAYVGMVSYWLRIMHYKDPVDHLVDHRYIEFYNWIYGELSKFGLFNFRSLVNDFKSVRDSSLPIHLRLPLILKFLPRLLNVSLRYLIMVELRSNFPAYLARVWISYSCHH